MRVTLRLASIALIAFCASPAVAAATQDDADRIAASLQNYLGKTPGLIAVVPDGDAFRLTLDATPLIAKIGDPNLSVTVTPIVLAIADQGNGTWKVELGQPLSANVKSAGAVDATVKAQRMTITSLFDTSAMAFLQSAADATGLSVDETVTPPGKPMTHVAYSIASIHSDADFTVGDDGVSGNVTTTMNGMAEAITLPGPLPLPVNVTATSGTGTRTVKGLRSRALTDLLAWFVAHPDREAMIADQAAAKNLARAALPLWDAASGTFALKDVAVATPMGQITAAGLSFAMSLNGIVAEGLLQEKITIDGLSLPPVFVPPWAARLVPTGLAFDLSVTGYDLATSAKLALDNLDVDKSLPLPATLEADLRKALLPTGLVTVTLGPSSVAAPAAMLETTAEMTAGPGIQATGKAMVSLKGFDDLQAAIGGAPVEAGLQPAMPILMMARGLARTDGDRLTWKIELGPNGSVIVNDTDLSKH
jgi:hypothetical protein